VAMNVFIVFPGQSHSIQCVIISKVNINIITLFLYIDFTFISFFLSYVFFLKFHYVTFSSSPQECKNKTTRANPWQTHPSQGVYARACVCVCVCVDCILINLLTMYVYSMRADRLKSQGEEQGCMGCMVDATHER